MQRQLCIKLLSRIPRNGSTPNFFSPNSPLNTNANPFHHFSHYSTLSPSTFSKLCSPNGVYRIQNGVFSTSLFATRFLSNAALKAPKSKFPVRVYTRRDFHSFDSKKRASRSSSTRLTSDGVVQGLIITNLAVFVLWNFAGTEFMVKNFMISVENFTSGRLHTLITSAFSHRDFQHIFSNMLGLYFFGLNIGQTFGAEYLLKLYLSGAVMGSVFYLLYQAFIVPSMQRTSTSTFSIDPSRVPALGASGAVNAIMLLDIFLHPRSTIYFSLVVPIPAFLVGIFIIGQDIWRASKGDQEVCGSAHLGGATVAALAWIRSRRGRFGRF